MKDARGHGSSGRGGGVAHQAGVNMIDRSMLTPLGVRTMQRMGTGTAQPSRTDANYYKDAAYNAQAGYHPSGY